MVRRTRYLWFYLALMGAALAAVGRARADYVIALHWPPEKCAPCRQMTPIENALRAQGFDIRSVDVLAHPEYDHAYPANPVTRTGRGVPRYAYVIERGGKSYDSGARIVGLATAGQLRRFCIAPGVVTVGAAARNAVRAMACPLMPFLEW